MSWPGLGFSSKGIGFFPSDSDRTRILPFGGRKQLQGTFATRRPQLSSIVLVSFGFALVKRVLRLQLCLFRPTLFAPIRLPLFHLFMLVTLRRRVKTAAPEDFSAM